MSKINQMRTFGKLQPVFVAIENYDDIDSLWDISEKYIQAELDKMTFNKEEDSIVLSSSKHNGKVIWEPIRLENRQSI